MTKVIKGGTILTADREWKADILIENEKIKQIGENLKGDETIDAEGASVTVSYTHLRAHETS